MQRYLLDNDPSGAYSVAALTSAAGFAVDFAAHAGQQTSVSVWSTDSNGTSPLSLVVRDGAGNVVASSQSSVLASGTGFGTAAGFVASKSGVYSATVQDAGGFSVERNIAVSVAEAGYPTTYLQSLHPEQSGTPHFAWADTTNRQTGTDDGQAYAGPVSYLQWQFLWTVPDSFNLSAAMPNVFLRGGPGNDALAASAGSNVLDGGTGSNFVAGGTGADGGTDTFFLDGRSVFATWDTVVNFHPGDAVTLWGFVPGQSAMSWADNEGAAGYQGATLHAAFAGPGTPVNGSVTFAGISLADAQSKFAISSGTAGGIPYLYAKYVG